MKKYYYIDDKGNKKYYVGKVINDYITGETYGLLTQQEVIHENVKLQFHEPIEAQNGWNSYFTYKDSSGNSVIYNGNSHNIKVSPIDNSYFITETKTDKIKLIKYDKIEYQPGYYTYINEYGKEKIYDGKIFYDKFTSTYYFYK